MSPPATRLLVVAFVAASLVAGGFYFVRSFRPPAGSEGREANVAPAPAGGRTQAMPGGDEPVAAPVDPLLPGITEAPDVPSTDAHRGIKKIGERIRDAVLEDGVVGDAEVPGVEFAASMPQAQRRWFVETAPGVACGCGCGQDLLECRRDDVSCPLSPALRDSLMAVALKR